MKPFVAKIISKESINSGKSLTVVDFMSQDNRTWAIGYLLENNRFIHIEINSLEFQMWMPIK